MLKTSLSIALLFAASPALAQAGATAPTANVRIADLNLSNSAGVAELDRRIERAVDAVCPAADTQELSRALAARSCRTKAANSAAGQRNAILAEARKTSAVQTASAR